jgi:3-hydroxypropanoate dehydrogenase
MPAPLELPALDQLFRNAQSTHAFTSEEVSDTTVHALYDLLKLGPTAFNSQPGRYVFIRSREAKARLAPALSSGNRDKTLAAPLTVIVAYDLRFFEHLPGQFASYAAKPMFVDDTALAETTALRNGSLQGAYLLLAARALGLGVGPMSGFNAEKVNREFFADSSYRVNFLANLGYPGGSGGRARGPRMEFAQVAEVI